MFLDQYKDRLKRRYESFQIALNWFDMHHGKTIVETGCVRLADDWDGAGMSTVIFGEYAKSGYNIDFYSIDISPENIETAKKLCDGLPVKFITADSHIGLQLPYPKTIDLLYLDSLDCEAAPEADNSLAQQHQLQELKLAMGKLSDTAAVLLDDCDFENGGKGRLSKEYLRYEGFYNLWEGYQSLWVRHK